MIDKILPGFVTSQEYRDGHCVSGREIQEKQLWFQRDGKYFCNTWKNRYDRWQAVDTYPEILNQISAEIKKNKELSDILKEHNIDFETMDINSCLVNKYRDGDDSTRAHRDTYLSFGEHPIIIGISIGDSRILRVRRLHNPEIFKSLKVQKSYDENIDFLPKDNSPIYYGRS